MINKPTDKTLIVRLASAVLAQPPGGWPATEQAETHQSESSTLRNPGSPDASAAARVSWRRDRAAVASPHSEEVPGLKAKDMAGVPWRFAFALQDDGWWLRRDIIWHKPNPMPESARDRPTTAHEYVFLFSKSERYFYNQAEAREPVAGTAHSRGRGVNPKCAGFADGPGSHRVLDHAREKRASAAANAKFPKPKQNASFANACSKVLMDDRNYRSVWTIPTQPYPESHFATFPERLASRCIIAGSRPGDVVLDPFGGSGTTGATAIELGRRAILIEINPLYLELIRRRCSVTPGLPI